MTNGKKVYISGPMTGVKDLNREVFFGVHYMIEDAGDILVNPHVVGKEAEKLPGFDNMTDKQKWQAYMRVDIKHLAQCDIVLALHGWESSKGATIEIELAKKIGIPVIPIDWYPF